MKFGRKQLETLRYHMVNTRSLYLPGLGLVPGCDRQTDRRTDVQNYDNILANTR